jgi:hypothetical protein
MRRLKISTANSSLSRRVRFSQVNTRDQDNTRSRAKPEPIAAKVWIIRSYQFVSLETRPKTNRPSADVAKDRPHRHTKASKEHELKKMGVSTHRDKVLSARGGFTSRSSHAQSQIAKLFYMHPISLP